MKRLLSLLVVIPLLAFAQGAPETKAEPKADAKAEPKGKAEAQGQQKKAAEGAGKFMKLAREGKDLYATIQTNHGDIVARLFAKDAPKTVENFVGLATGEKPWRNPQGQDVTGKPLYDNTIFHRVIPNFMIQGGDPTGTGMGDPGYRFEDEFQSGRKFDKVGLLAMANAGPGTNGSQFFITTKETPWLNNRHTIFGEVISGYDVVMKISDVPRGPQDRPATPVTIKHIQVTDKAPKAAKPEAKPKK